MTPEEEAVMEEASDAVGEGGRESVLAAAERLGIRSYNALRALEDIAIDEIVLPEASNNIARGEPGNAMAIAQRQGIHTTEGKNAVRRQAPGITADNVGASTEVQRPTHPSAGVVHNILDLAYSARTESGNTVMTEAEYRNASGALMEDGAARREAEGRGTPMAPLHTAPQNPMELLHWALGQAGIPLEGGRYKQIFDAFTRASTEQREAAAQTPDAGTAQTLSTDPEAFLAAARAARNARKGTGGGGPSNEG